jgi:hypothetical protein
VNKKGISALVIVAIVVIAVVVVGVVAYYVFSNGGGGEENGGGEEGNGVAEANSLTFDVNANVSGAEEFDKFTVKNLQSGGILLRVDQTDAQGNEFTYLLNETAQSAWADFGTGFIDDSANYQTYADNTLIGFVALDGYIQELANWSGSGDYDFTHNGDSFVISNIYVDPEVPDSVFLPE